MPIGTALAPRVAAGTPCVDGWAVMPTDANLGSGGLAGAASLAGQPAWVVGRRQSKAIVGRWDAASSIWRSVPVPWTTDTGLTAISPMSSTVAWTAGYSNIYTPRSIAGRWNGSQWSSVTVPHLGGRAQVFLDVATINSKRMLAVGSRLNAGKLLPVAMFRYKTTWTNKSPVLNTNQEGAITTVTRAPTGTLWAAGWRSTNGAMAPWIARWSGTAWVETPAADTGGGLVQMSDITFTSASQGWVAGYRERTQGGYAPVLQRWDGLAWQEEALPWDADSSVVLTTVAVDGTGRVFVAGQHVTNSGAHAVLAVNNGGTWSSIESQNDPYPGTWSQEASALADGAFVVGQFNGPIALASCPDSSPPPTAQPGNGQDPATGHIPPPSAYLEDVGPRSTSSNGPAAITTGTLEGYHALNVTAAAGLTLQSMTYGAVVADFNEDTWPDVWINRHGDAVPFFRLGSATGFTDPGATFQYTDRHLCDVDDVDGDTHLDMFCTVGRRQGTAMGVHELLLNVGSTGGSNATAEFNLLDVSGRGRATAFVHLASDTYPALFIGNEPVRIDGLPSFNRFYRNVDGEHYEPAPNMGLDVSSGAVCAYAANLDADADDELLVCTTELRDGRKPGTHIYDFNGTTFVDRTAEWGISPLATVDLAIADFNGDALPDLAQLNRSKLRVSLAQVGGGFATAYELVAKLSYALATGDVNADLRPDIYVSRQALGNGFHLMLVNDGDGTSFTNVQIPQPGSGTADDVVAIDYDKNGLTDFLTTNGFTGQGPVRLTAFFPDEP